MSGKARVFVGCDERSGVAERALESSILRNATIEVQFVWMRHSDPPFDWSAVPRLPWEPGGWATQYSNFRYALPEICDFQGRAIFLDSDMVVLGDIRELWDAPQTRPWRSISLDRTHVSVIECEPFKDAAWWPRLRDMKASRRPGMEYLELLRDNGFFDFSIDPAWDSRDSYDPKSTKLIHFTNMMVQPWAPWPERFQYGQHPDQAATDLFWQYARMHARSRLDCQGS